MSPMVTRGHTSKELKRQVFLFEIERGVSRNWALVHVGWTETAYWSQRFRHPDWAYRVDRAFQTTSANGLRGTAIPLEGRAFRGALQRHDFLELIERG
jgi:hypothetical protein